MSIKDRTKKIKTMFEIFDDPMDKYTQIIELGKKNIALESNYKNDRNRIFGCASLAWVHTNKNNNLYSIKTDSDTFIVKGLLYILEYTINDSTKKEIIDINIKDILKNIGLEESITSQRTNGFLSALEKIKEQIEQYD